MELDAFLCGAWSVSGKLVDARSYSLISSLVDHLVGECLARQPPDESFASMLFLSQVPLAVRSAVATRMGRTLMWAVISRTLSNMLDISSYWISAAKGKKLCVGVSLDTRPAAAVIKWPGI